MKNSWALMLEEKTEGFRRGLGVEFLNLGTTDI